jgi:hypothetical protein
MWRAPSPNECFELALCPLVVEKGAADAAKQRGKLPQEWIFVITIEQVRAARGLLGWSQSELARRAGFSPHLLILSFFRF